jgi:hypothetical protein
MGRTHGGSGRGSRFLVGGELRAEVADVDLRMRELRPPGRAGVRRPGLGGAWPRWADAPSPQASCSPPPFSATAPSPREASRGSVRGGRTVRKGGLCPLTSDWAPRTGRFSSCCRKSATCRRRLSACWVCSKSCANRVSKPPPGPPPFAASTHTSLLMLSVSLRALSTWRVVHAAEH